MAVYLRIRHHQRQCDLARLRKLDRDPKRQLIERPQRLQQSRQSAARQLRREGC